MTPEGRHSTLVRAVAAALGVLFLAVFIALGTWQVKRRAWKLDLIARVEQRVHAPPVALPEAARWPLVTATSDEYRHVKASGTFIDGSQTLVHAVTELGAGFWVLTPLRMADGTIVLVNRGFVPSEARTRIAPEALTSITGLLRMTEPGGAFLRHNDPADNHWYSRDVQAIAAARGLTGVAPFFIDAESSAGHPLEEGARADRGFTGPSLVTPIGGLTVIRFHNNHLVYAVTWYTLALMTAAALWLGSRNETHT